MVERAMVLAAGLGVRMRPLTDSRPKALVELHGVTLLDRAFAKCRAAGVSAMVVNSHYKAEMIHAHVDGMDDVVLSPEDDLLETGGGVCKALPHLGSQPFYVINCDSVWNDKSPPALARLSEAWRDNDMDGLLLLQQTENAVGYNGAGDFSIDAAGRMQRRAEGDTAPLVFMGVQLLHPRLFEGCVVARYSLNRLYDQALTAGRLFGLVHDDDWFHVGTPEDLVVTERLMRADGPSE
ncbi:MAG: nucleotidyltransferase family protein [Rhodospirillaceae bacterium]|nr:nucleotidyltransferase family protein [Rhodospirillaceae bacterium]